MTAREIEPKPLRPVPIPSTVMEAYAGWDVELVWAHQPHTSTWRLAAEGSTHFVKVARREARRHLRREAERLQWIAGRLPIPQLIRRGSVHDHDWMVTQALPGRNAIDDALRADPEWLVSLLAAALRLIHQTPATDCPWTLDLDGALARARRRVSVGRFDEAELEPKGTAPPAGETLEALQAQRPENEELVLCHGDFCLPNVIIDGDALSGFVDLGDLALSERWFDLAIASRSVGWNLGPQWEAPFLRAYGVEPDEFRIRYFRTLYDLME